MSDSSAAQRQLVPLDARRQRLLALAVFLFAAFAIELRINISPHIMNLIVNYSGEAGPVYEKLHFGTLAMFALLPIAIAGRPFILQGSEIGLFKSLLLFSVIMLALIVYLGVMGRAGASGFIIDTYVVSSAAGLIMLTLPAVMRRAIGDITLCLLVVSAVIGFGEALAHHHLLPYNRVDDAFRPIGLTMHPLALGAACATGIGFAAVARWPIWMRAVAIFILYIGCAVSTARTSFVLASVEIFLVLLFTRWPKLSDRAERQAKFVVLLLFVLGGAILIATLFATGFLYRFDSSVTDDSVMARVTIYRVFSFFSWSDILFGVHLEQLMDVVNKRLHINFVESAPVMLIMLFGLPAALVFAATLFWMFARLFPDTPFSAKAGAIISIIAGLSNNTFTTKTPAIAIIFVLMIAYRHALPALDRGALRQANRAG